jgi:hypothetical protein
MSTYTTLQAQIRIYMHREDLNFFAIPTFIEMAEARIYRDLRVPEMAAEATLNTVDGVAPLPDRFLDMRDISYNPTSFGSIALTSVGRHGIARVRERTGRPLVYSILGESIEIRPTDDTADFYLQYWQAPEPLVDVNENAVLDRYPYLYLYGSLFEGGVYTKDPELTQLAEAKYQQDLATTNAEADYTRFGESPTMTVA